MKITCFDQPHGNVLEKEAALASHQKKLEEKVGTSIWKFIVSKQDDGQYEMICGPARFDHSQYAHDEKRVVGGGKMHVYGEHTDVSFEFRGLVLIGQSGSFGRVPEDLRPRVVMAAADFFGMMVKDMLGEDE